MESPATSQHEELGRRIRSLTTILHRFTVQKPPTPHKEMSVFLRHFTTFLMFDDTQAKKAVAVAGSISPGQRVRAVVAVQNRDSATSPAHNMRLTVVDRDDIRTTDQDSDLVRHVKEVLGVLSTFDPVADDPTAQKTAFQVFFLTRCFGKFAARFKEDRLICGGKRLYEVIAGWNPDPNMQELPHSWVNGPEWLSCFTEPDDIPSRTIEGQLQFEFSDRTKHAWSKVLVVMLTAVEMGIEKVKKARSLSGATAEESKEALDELNTAVHHLYYFISWEANVVKSLLTRTKMVSVFMDSDDSETDDDVMDTYQGPQETKGQLAFHHLQMVTVWHAAVHCFCSNRMFPEILKNLKVGLVEVPCSPSSVLSLEEIRDEFFSRFPRMLEQRETVLKEIERRHKSFSSCVHAEAVLMGLLSCARADLGDDLGMGLEDSAMQDIVQPVAEEAHPTIAISNKCCWCCDWLGRNIGTDFILPGTHGIMFPWDPPKIGVSVSVLGRLEQELWQALHNAVSSAVGHSYSRLGSPDICEIKLSDARRLVQMLGETVLRD